MAELIIFVLPFLAMSIMWLLLTHLARTVPYPERVREPTWREIAVILRPQIDRLTLAFAAVRPAAQRASETMGEIGRLLAELNVEADRR